MLNVGKSSGSVSTVKGLLMNSVFCHGLTSSHYNFVYNVISLSLSIYMYIHIFIYLCISCNITLGICADAGCSCKYLLKKHSNTACLENK